MSGAMPVKFFPSLNSKNCMHKILKVHLLLIFFPTGEIIVVKLVYLLLYS